MNAPDWYLSKHVPEIIDALAADPSTGFEYRMDYRTAFTGDIFDLVRRLFADYMAAREDES